MLENYSKKMKNFINIFSLIFGLTVFAQSQVGMIEPDSIALVEDKFQEFFYESLKQKGIENYDRAVNSLQQALQLKPDEATLYHEIGKNYFFQKKYVEAENYIKQAIEKDNSNKYFYLSLYDVYYQTKNYPKSIEIVQKLIGFNDKRKFEFQDDLVSLYMYTEQFDKALTLIEELEKTTSYDPVREMYKLQILKSKAENFDISDLESEIRKNPKNEQAYIALIYQYSESNQEEKAFEVAKQLAKNIPDSDWAHVSLFKFYLEENNIRKAVNSMNKVFESGQIDDKIKHRVLNEFLIFVSKNPQFDKELEKAIAYFKNDPNIAVAKEVGKFYFAKQNWKEASDYFEISLKDNQNDLETILLLLQSYTEMGSFDIVSEKSDNFKDLFPLQPELYYYSGLSQNQMKNYQKAKNALEEGLDYLIDNRSLEINFYIQLSEASQGLGNEKDEQKYKQKAENLMKRK